MCGPRIMVLPKIESLGNLTVIEAERQIPFKIKRIYYIYDVPTGQGRGGHAHKNLEQLIIAINGSFDVIIEDKTGRKVFHLERADQGLYISRMTWREIENISPGAVCLVVASELYDESDYIRDYANFKKQLMNDS
jgi:oxalate decarboxylase/phosphoglucose isomerase-like protein (cupin superfamily)